MENARMVVDTGIFIDFFRKTDKRNSALYKIPNATELFISTITFYELMIGATDDNKRASLHKILEPVTILPFSSKMAEEAAKIQLELKKKNKMIEVRDLFIASTAVISNLPLLTLNKKHFSRVPMLSLI